MSKGNQSSFNMPEGVDPQEASSSKPSAMPDTSNAACSGYEIRIKDHLETYWYEWFEGWSISNLECGEVLLKRSNVDQSALHGALNKIRDLNLMLLSVARIS